MCKMELRENMKNRQYTDREWMAKVDPYVITNHCAFFFSLSSHDIGRIFLPLS